MTRLLAGLFLLTALLTGCAPTGPQLPAGAYQIRPGDVPEIQYRMLDSVNALRARTGVAPVTLDPRLTAAAQAHAVDMSRQRRAWPFGADGSSPYDRLARAGYDGALVAELYAQTFETELDTLAAWVDDGAWGPEILAPDATDMGFAWQQDPSGLLWWVIVMGDRSTAGPRALSDVPAF